MYRKISIPKGVTEGIEQLYYAVEPNIRSVKASYQPV